MVGMDKKLVKKETELMQKLYRCCKWEEKQKAELDLYQEIGLSSSDNTDSEPFSTEKESGSLIVANKLTRKRGRKNIIIVDVMMSQHHLTTPKQASTVLCTHFLLVFMLLGRKLRTLI